MKNSITGLFFILFALNTWLYADIENKIQTTKQDLVQQELHEKRLARKLDEIAQEITTEEQKLSTINQDILATKQKINEQTQKSTVKTDELKKIEAIYQDLLSREKTVNQKMTEILSKGISLEMITSGANQNDLSDMNENSADNIVLQQIYTAYSLILKEKFAATKTRYVKLQQNIEVVKTELDKIKLKLTDLRGQITEYDKLKSLKKNSLTMLDSERKAYLDKLNRIKKERDILGETLAKLNITKRDQERERQLALEREKEAKKAAIIAPSSPSGSSEIAQPALAGDVRQIGSSFQASSTTRYNGPKTIAPLESYTLTQTFGTTTDPIYKIKIFNDSIILKASEKNARVQNVLDGKVIYADNTSMLDNVVIVKNRDNIHTIYAHLSQIAPTIKVGQAIPQGYTLGRVDQELTFQVTQNEKHINPTELIR